MPLLRPTLAVTIVLNVLYGLKVFDMVYALTNGGQSKLNATGLKSLEAVKSKPESNGQPPMDTPQTDKRSGRPPSQ